VVNTGDVTPDRGDVGVTVGIPAHAGAVAGVELGRCCDGDASAAGVKRVERLGLRPSQGFSKTPSNVLRARHS